MIFRVLNKQKLIIVEIHFLIFSMILWFFLPSFNNFNSLVSTFSRVAVSNVLYLAYLLVRSYYLICRETYSTINSTQSLIVNINL